MARTTQSKRRSSVGGERKLSKGGAINRTSIRGTARGENPKVNTPNSRRTTRVGSARKAQEDSPTRGPERQRRSTAANRQIFGTIDSSERDPDSAGANRARGGMGEPGQRFAQGRGAPGRAKASQRKSGADGGNRFEYDERDSTDSAERTGWSGMDEERQKRPASRDNDTRDRDWSRTNAGAVDNDYEETLSQTSRRRRSGRRSARADAGDHATPGRGQTADTEGHVSGAAARGRRGDSRVDEAAGRGRAGRPRNDW